MPFFSSFTGSFSVGRRRPISIGGGGGGGAATYSLDGASVSSTFTTSAAPHHFQFNADGTEITGTFGGDLLYTTSLSTPYDPTTGSYSISNPSHQLGIGALGASTIYGFRFNDDGTKAFFTHQTILTPSRGQVTEYSLSTPYDISTLSSTGTTAYDTEGDFAATDLLNINSIAFNADGTKMFLQSGDSIAGLGIFEYDLSSAYTLSTASYSRGFLYTSVLPANLQPFNILFNNAGTKLYVTDFRYDSIYEFDLSTGFDLSTISYNNVSLNFAATDTIPRQMMLSQDETQMYIMGAQNDNIYTLDLVQDAGFGGGGGGAVSSADFSSTTLTYTLDNPNPYADSNSDQFGYVVAISTNYAIVTAPAEDEAAGSQSGKAYIFDLSDGSLLYTLDNPNAYDTAGSDFFGRAAAITDTHAIVGTYFEDDANGTTSGKAYIFDLSDGSLLYTLDNPNPYGTSTDDRFANSVAINDSYAIVGSPYEDEAGGDDSGKAYIYNLSDGSLAYTLDNPNAYDTVAGDRFGEAVAINSGYVIVGAPGEDDAGGTFSGKAYVFDLSDGSLTYTLDNPNAYNTSQADLFSQAVAMSESYAIVGAYTEDDAGGTTSGKAYVFDLSDGSLLYTLDNPNAYDTSANDRFANSVAINDSYAIVGAYFEDDAGGTQSGKAYIFDLSDGSLVNTLDNPNAYSTSAGDYFGISVGMGSGYVIVGARDEDDAAGTDSGKAYIFQGS